MEGMVMTRHAGTLDDRGPVRVGLALPAVRGPARRCALRVELDYERSGAIMDLGCMGAGRVPRLVRRRAPVFVITATAATPGYLPGELEPGTWQIVIGLHRVPPDGAEYRVTIEVSSQPGELDSGRPGPSRCRR